MSVYRKTYRLQCDSSKIDQVVDQTTGARPSITINEDLEFQIALFTNGVLIPKSNISTITVTLFNTSFGVVVQWMQFTANLSELNVGSWTRGVGFTTAVILTAGQTLSIGTTPLRLVVSGNLNSVPLGSSGKVNFASIMVDIKSAVDGTTPATPPTPGPPTAWTKAESDARFAVKATETGANDTADYLTDISEWLEYTPGVPIKFVSAGGVQTFTGAEKIQARANIGAALLQTTDVQTLAAGATYVPTPQVHSRFQLTLNGNATFANAAAFPEWTPGKYYEFMITQDATGSRTLSWGNLYIFPTHVAIDPQPNSITTLFGRWEGSYIRIWEAEPKDIPFPDVMVHAGRGTGIASGNYNPWLEIISNDSIGTFIGGASAGIFPVAGGLNGRPAANFPGNAWMRYPGTHPPATQAAGCTVAVVFSSSGVGTPQFLARLARFGIEVKFDTGNLHISAFDAAAPNRVALPFSQGSATTPKLFIGTIRGSGLGGGMALNELGIRTFVPSATMSTPASGGWEYLMGNANVATWTGYLNQILIFGRALTWSEMVAVRRALFAEVWGM
jgi:hypothetical protein